MDSTVHKAFWVLEWLAAHPAPQRLTDIAAGMGMSKASVHRLLATLGELGYVAHDDVHGRYGVTLRLWEIGRGLIADTDLHTVAAPEMRSLASLAGESAALGMLDHGLMVFVGQVESPTAIRAVARLGQHVPATVVALGKAMLAFGSHESLAEAMAHLEPFTPRTLTRAEDIEADLEATRARGYAISAGEWKEGIAGVAAPVFDAAGHAIAAVGVWGAEPSILGEREGMLVQLVTRSAATVSKSLGYVPARAASARGSSSAMREGPERRPRAAPPVLPVAAAAPQVRPQKPSGGAGRG